MRTLEETIKHCEEVAEAEEQKYKEWKGDYSHLKKIDSCLECASEHRQLAEWLSELRMYREVIDNKSFKITDPFNPHGHHVLVVKVTDLYDDFIDF